MVWSAFMMVGLPTFALDGIEFFKLGFVDSSSNFLVNSLSIVKLGGPKTKTLSTMPKPNAICAIPYITKLFPEPVAKSIHAESLFGN